MGFPALQNSKNFSQYFASFINSGRTGLPVGTKVYKYVGGNLSDSNPALLNVSASSPELVAPNTAYWFSMPAVSDFSGPLSYEMASSDGLAFGRSVTMLTLGIKNRTTASLTCNFELDSSSAAPSRASEALMVEAVPVFMENNEEAGEVYVVDGVDSKGLQGGRMTSQAPGPCAAVQQGPAEQEVFAADLCDTEDKESIEAGLSTYKELYPLLFEDENMTMNFDMLEMYIK
jgi:hypothetical protein